MGQTGRRQFLIAASSALAAAPFGLRAQPAGRMARVGLLASALPSNPVAAPIYDALWAELRSLGWIEGKNLAIEARYAEGQFERFPDLAAELVNAGVDVIVASIPPAVEAARDKTRRIPIVMVFVPDPVEAGYVASLARPGGNVTGLAYIALNEIPLKNLELLLEIAPGARRIGVLWSPKDPASANSFGVEQPRAEKLGVTEVSLPVAVPEDIDSALELAQRERIQALRVYSTPVIFQEVRRVAAWAAKQRLPSTGGPREAAQAGLLASYNPDYRQLYRVAAAYVDRILRGANPAEMPVEQPTKFVLVVNLKTAKAIGITIPQSVLLRADEVIE